MEKSIFKNNSGFSLLEIIVSLAIFSGILLVLISFFLSANASNLKTLADREASENAQRLLDTIVNNIRSAKSIYTPTTTATQLSLETIKYLPAGQTHTFIDFFLCGNAVCLKKELQDAVALTSDSVKVTNIAFSKILTGTNSSVKVDLTVSYLGTGSDKSSSTISLTSTASLRSY